MRTPIPVDSRQSVLLEAVARAFHDGKAAYAFSTLGRGNINDTYLAVAGPVRFILQRINAGIFPEPWKVAHNSALVSSLLADGPAVAKGLKVTEILKTSAGEFCHIDCLGHTWRAQSYIAGSRVFERIDSPARARQAGRCLALFHQGVEGAAPALLHEVLPGFHDLPGYLRDFDGALGQWQGPLSPELRFCCEQISQLRDRATFFQAASRRGDVILQIVHGDPKLANILFDAASGEAVAMIDLDTVGPGLLLYDIGDCLRSCCSSLAEDDRQPAGAVCDISLVEALMRGYLAERPLPAFDLEHVHDAFLLVAFELGVRFVTDYLQGNRYFKVAGDSDNLRRAMVQFHLADSIAVQQSRICGVVAEAGEYHRGERENT